MLFGSLCRFNQQNAYTVKNQRADDKGSEKQGDMKYTIYVPVNLDGREIGKATATYTREEIEKQETRENRKKGRRTNV